MNVEKIISDAAASLGKTGVSIARGILLIAIITRFAGEYEYGLWVSIIAVVGTLSPIGGLHLQGALIRYRPTEDTPGQVFSDTVAIAALAAAFFVVMVIAVETTVGFLPTENGHSFLPGVASLVTIQILSYPILHYPRAINRVKHFELIQTTKLLFELLGVATAILLVGTIRAALWSYVLVGASCIVVVLLWFRPMTTMPSVFRFRQYIKYSLPMVPKALGSKLLTNADKYLILYFISPTAVAVYGVIYNISGFLTYITTPLNSTLYPAVVNEWQNGSGDGLSELYSGILRWFTLIGVPSIAGLVLLGRPLIELISTTNIANSGEMMLPILLIGFLFRGYDNTLTYILNATEENVKLAKITVSSATVNILMNIFLIPTIGIEGAAVSTLVSQILITIYITYHAQKRVQFTLPIQTAGKALISTLVMSVILVTLPIPSWAKLGVYPVVGLIAYLVTIVLLRGITKEDWGQIKGVILSNGG